MTTLPDLEAELVHLVLRREAAVGIDLKRTNYKIAELQGKIYHAERAER